MIKLKLNTFPKLDNTNIPVITDLEQLSENSVRIRWTFSSLNYLLRYRVEISSDNFVNVIHEWPAQLHKIIPDTNGPVIDRVNTKSNYECFNECIKNPFCYTASRVSNCSTDCLNVELNCNLKGKYDVRHLSSDLISTKDDYQEKTNRTRATDTTNNEAYLYNLPYDYVWRFRVSVFDQTSGKWSKFSGASEPLNFHISKISLQ